LGNCRERGKAHGYSSGQYFTVEETASLWKQGMGSFADGSGFSLKMYGMRPSDYDSPPGLGKKCEGNQAKALKTLGLYDIILTRDIF
jgi:hypothetical protein